MHFSSGEPSIDQLENVVAELQTKELFTSDVSSLGKQQCAEDQMKHLVAIVSHGPQELLADLFEITSRLGIRFTNLPEVNLTPHILPESMCSAGYIYI